MMSYQTRIVVAFLGLGVVVGSRCGITPSWPYGLDASGFTDFHYLGDPPCQDVLDQLVTNYVCEASIVRKDSGDYVFQGSYTAPTDVVEVQPRTLTEAEVTRMLSLFSDLHYDPANGLFCHAPLPGLPAGWESFLRWDDREFITYGCGRPRIDVGEVSAIEDFLNALREGD
jgi:hypothetical protein